MHLDHLTRRETLPEQAKRLGTTDIDFVFTPGVSEKDSINSHSGPISGEHIRAGTYDAIEYFHDLLSRLLKK